MKMRGYYNFYRNGKLVLQQENLITTLGRRFILRYLSGQIPAWADAIAVGTSNTAPATTDITLGFEFDRAEVGLKAVDISTGRITAKGSLNIDTGGKIYEVGLFPKYANDIAGAFGTKMLASFETDLENWSGGSRNTTNWRAGASSLQINASTSGTTTAALTEYGVDISGYSNIDQFGLGYFINDVNTSSIVVRLKTDVSNYYAYTFSPGSVTGYFIKNFTKSNFVATGSPDWSNIQALEISVTAGAGGATAPQMDGFIIIDKDKYENYAIVSRAVPATPLTKNPGESLDIEYVLEFDIV